MSNALFPRPRHLPQHPRRSFAIVSSQYNETYSRGLVEHARAELHAISAGSEIAEFEVPGAFEIPLVVEEVARQGKFEAILALGVIIEGKTQHADLIGREVTTALQQIALRNRVPVIHEVILVRDEAQAQERCLGETINRGTEAARVAVKMAVLMSELKPR
ncbi:MAG: 6,7-dimethyl-8-ribityllumazine synthase [Verrucomicrobiota bacterium]|nr:6,7-dimethyl-8-ribityllumazine synthase [Verrucomicrobiota bacterium]